MKNLFSSLRYMTITISLFIAFADAAKAMKLNTGGGSDLIAGEKLHTGEFLISTNGKFKLIVQPDGNVVLFKKFVPPANTKFPPIRVPDRLIWESHTSGNSGDYFTLQNDGNIVIYSKNDQSIWSTGSQQVLKSNKYYFRVGDIGDMILFGDKYARLWTSMTPDNAPVPDHLNEGESIEPGKAIYSSNRYYHLECQTDGNLVLYRKGDGKAIWNSKTNGSQTGGLLFKDGRLHLLNKKKNGDIWFSGTTFKCCKTVTVLLQNDGNLVIYDSSGKGIWYSNTAGGKGSDFNGTGYGGCGC